MPRTTRLGVSWLLLCAALALHVADEAYHDFLSVYNPTVRALRERFVGLPAPTFQYEEWLTGLIVLCAVLALLSPAFFRGAGTLRWPATIFASLMVLNGVGHIAGTVAGRTVAAVQFARPMPGFYSSPLLIAAAVYLLIQLHKPTPRNRPAGL